MTRAVSYVALFILACGSVAALDATTSTHTIVAPASIKWGDPPPVFEKGMSFTVIYGDPGKPGPFVVRAKLPAGYKIKPHWHPTTENVTVLSGTMAIGMGEKFDEGSMTEVPTAGFVSLPAEMRHFAMAKTAAMIQIHGEGPFGLTYVNPADDPSKRAPAK